ncbi:MAG: c-type cytochrome [Gammaproteobacteria bacterium]
MKIMSAFLLVLLLAACGRQGGEDAAQAPAPTAAATDDASVPAQKPGPEPQPAQTPPSASPTAATPAVDAEPVKPDVKPSVAVPGKDEALALAQQSGCLACHKIEAKLVGPAWQDVSAKYRDDPEARARLTAKVKQGGQGNWTEVTGGMPMPPYSPRVSDENIERLVTFILSL